MRTEHAPRTRSAARHFDDGMLRATPTLEEERRAGSGIDALLFGLGKQAKKMRLSKVSELIHASPTVPNWPSAAVEVTFPDIIDTGDGLDDFAVVDGSLLVVGRKAFRNNQPRYDVDGKTSNFTDVTQLLRKRGLLEHLEDIGPSRFVEPITHSEVVDKLTESRTEKLNRLRVAEQESDDKKLQGHMEEHRKKMEGFESQVNAIAKRAQFSLE